MNKVLVTISVVALSGGVWALYTPETVPGGAPGVDVQSAEIVPVSTMVTVCVRGHGCIRANAEVAQAAIAASMAICGGPLTVEEVAPQARVFKCGQLDVSADAGPLLIELAKIGAALL